MKILQLACISSVLFGVSLSAQAEIQPCDSKHCQSLYVTIDPQTQDQLIENHRDKAVVIQCTVAEDADPIRNTRVRNRGVWTKVFWDSGSKTFSAVSKFDDHSGETPRHVEYFNVLSPYHNIQGIFDNVDCTVSLADPASTYGREITLDWQVKP